MNFPALIAPATNSRFPLAGPSFSHGLALRDCVAEVPCPVRTVSGISLMPGIGLPDCIKSTIS